MSLDECLLDAVEEKREIIVADSAGFGERFEEMMREGLSLAFGGKVRFRVVDPADLVETAREAKNPYVLLGVSDRRFIDLRSLTE